MGTRWYTIEQFSAMINKSKATLSKYENGAITIDIETLYEISQALDIELKYFVDYQPPTFRNEPAPVSYTHLDVYKRQPSPVPTAVCSPGSFCLTTWTPRSCR